MDSQSNRSICFIFLSLAAALLAVVALVACSGDGAADIADPGDTTDGTDSASDPDATEDPSSLDGDAADDSTADTADSGGDIDSTPPPFVAGDAGHFGLFRADGSRLLTRARAEAMLADETTASTADCAGSWEPIEGTLDDRAPLDDLVGARFRCEGDPMTLIWEVWTALDGPRGVAIVTAKNSGAEPVTVLRLSPVVTELDDDGGLFVGADLARLRVLDNGSNLFNDIEVQLQYVTAEPPPFILDLLPIPHRGDLVANWNHAIVDLDSGDSWIAGALTAERTIPTMGLVAEGEERSVVDGRVGLAAFYADMGLEFDGKTLDPGDSVSSEPLWFDGSADDGLAALETYAEGVAAWNDIVVWTDRGGGRPVPNGWNSWSGSSSTGGLGKNIDEALMREVLDVMARELEPFGIDYFQIDDGYMPGEGDWVAREDTFPSGIEDLSARIEDAGLLPGIWISAFIARTDSELAAAHPDWLLGPERNVTMGLFDSGDELRPLDLSNTDVVDWLVETMRRYRDDWRMRWLKLDFAYFAAIHRPLADPSLTAIEAYRRAIEAIDDALGDDVVFMGVGMFGVNFGVADTIRLTLDDGPLWEEDDPFAFVGTGNNFKNAVRVGSRRWYFGGRVWVNHNDLLFFRTDRSNPDRPITFDESRAFNAYIALGGGIVKFGEDLRTLTPEQILEWRRLIPAYPRTARPLDVFERLYAEVYHLPVRGTLAGSDASWDIVGLFHWGRNWDYSGDRRVEMPDGEPRTHDVSLESIGLDADTTWLAFDYTSQTFVGVLRETLSMTLAPHGHAVVALRAALDHPQFVGHDRHVTMGATDLVGEAWDGDARTLTVSLDVDAGGPSSVPMPYRVTTYAPTGFGAPTVSITGPAGDPATETSEVASGLITTVEALPSEPGRWNVVFDYAPP